MVESPDFWDYLDELVQNRRLVIDRPQSSRHLRFPELVYSLDYGYLAGTTSSDGHGVDVWLGTLTPPKLDSVLITVDLYKRDVEIKILLGCTPAEKEQAQVASSRKWMAAELIMRRSDG
jgi:inorganic pyrophosphatase